MTNRARWLIVLIPGLLLYLLPLPALNLQQRHLLAIFTSSVIALIAQPVPMGVTAIIALTVLAVTKTIAPAAVFSGYSNATVWLIVSAFLFASAITSTRFGLRVALLFIRRFGKSALALSYSIAGAGVVLAPFVPSDTARGGGIISPIVASIARALRSEPGPTADDLGAFLTLVGFHTNYTASAMFLTGMAANPLMADFARQIAHVDITWTTWALGASVPGVMALVIVPWVISRVHPPRLRATELARGVATDELLAMGPVSRNEVWLVAILLLVMAGWVTSPWHGVSNTVVALAGVSALLLAGVISWEELLAERKAWDVMIWFGAVIMMADNLVQSGVVSILSARVFLQIQNWSAIGALVGLVTLYLYVHYAFASMTAQATALYPTFLAALLASGMNPLVSALSLGYFSNLNASTTHYGTGSAPVFFGTGYVSQREWWRVGFLLSLVNLALWLGGGLLWWKVLGWW